MVREPPGKRSTPKGPVPGVVVLRQKAAKAPPLREHNHSSTSHAPVLDEHKWSSDNDWPRAPVVWILAEAHPTAPCKQERGHSNPNMTSIRLIHQSHGG